MKLVNEYLTDDCLNHSKEHHRILAMLISQEKVSLDIPNLLKTQHH